MKHIASRHHPLVATCRALARGKGPADLLLLDGLHLLAEAVSARLPVITAVFTERALSSQEGAALAQRLGATGTELMAAADAVLDAMSPVTSPSGAVALARRPVASIDTMFAARASLVVVGVDVQDPGNVGAMARAAEAGGASGLVLAGASADPFGWKALRGSMGSLLRLPVAAGLRWEEAIESSRRAGARVLAAAPRGGTTMYDLDLRGPAAILLGGEGPGLPPAAAAAADALVSIPMRPGVESLNVAVATALLVYEAARQRR